MHFAVFIYTHKRMYTISLDTIYCNITDKDTQSSSEDLGSCKKYSNEEKTLSAAGNDG